MQAYVIKQEYGFLTAAYLPEEHGANAKSSYIRLENKMVSPGSYRECFIYCWKSNAYTSNASR